MKKLINNVDDLLADSLKGFARAHQDIVRFNAQPAFISRAPSIHKQKSP